MILKEKTKELISNLQEYYARTAAGKVLIWGTILLTSVILTFLIENFYFNYGRFRSHSLSPSQITILTEDMTEENGVYTPTSDSANLIFAFPESYIYKFKFFGESLDGESIQYEIISPDAYLPDSEVTFATFKDTEETALIDEVVDNFMMTVYNAQGRSFKIEDIQLDYTFSMNPIRVGVTFIILLVSFYTILALLGIVKFSYQKFALVYILVFGLMASVLIPAKESYDEGAHLFRASYIANGEFFTTTDTDGLIPEGFTEFYDIDYRSLEDFYQSYDELAGSDPSVLVEYTGNLPSGSYLFTNYIFSAFGLFLARILGVPLFFYPFFGRAFNIIFYAVAVFFGIKFFTNKPLMFFLSLTPLMLSLAASFGTSVIQNGFLFLGVGYLAYLITQKEKITWVDYLFLSLCFVMVTIARVASGFFILLMLLLPNDKIENKALRLSNKILTVLICLVAIIGVFKYSSSIGLDLISQPNRDFNEQLQNVIAHPFRFVRRMWNYMTITYLDESNILQELGFIVYSGRLPGLYTLIAAVVMVILTFAGDHKEVAFDSFSSKLLMWGTFILTVAATEASLYLTYTIINYYSVDGFQSRYILSVILVPLAALESKNFYLKFNERTLATIDLGSILILMVFYMGLLVTKFYG